MNSYECECGWGSLVACAPPRAHVNSCSVQFIVSSELVVSRLCLPDTMVRLAVINSRIILSRNGYTLQEIKARLEEESVHIPQISLYLLLKKYREMGSFIDRPRARVLKKLTDAHYV